jgi:hypothetical protein
MAFGSLVLGADSANAKSRKKVWILHQTSDMGGAAIVYVTDDAVKSRQRNLAVVCSVGHLTGKYTVINRKISWSGLVICRCSQAQ